ncbi:MAG: DUF1737 domain-containing protein [Chitinophagaceae bacterium]|nr:DUF1737 domain-containing protein [Chitinophagaceae bacterium]MBP7109166.1 DUF1737 domain-containing protein [Chitinophagaceae bacterium]
MENETFKIIQTSDKQFFEKQVNELLDSGWKTNGNFYAFATYIDESGAVKDITYVQAMILE